MRFAEDERTDQDFVNTLCPVCVAEAQAELEGQYEVGCFAGQGNPARDDEEEL